MFSREHFHIHGMQTHVQYVVYLVTTILLESRFILNDILIIGANNDYLILHKRMFAQFITDSATTLPDTLCIHRSMILDSVTK